MGSPLFCQSVGLSTLERAEKRTKCESGQKFGQKTEKAFFTTPIKDILVKSLLPKLYQKKKGDVRQSDGNFW